MTLRLIVPAIAGVALLVSTAAAAPSLARNGPAQVTLKQDRLTRQGQHKQLYALFTARFKAQCPYAKFREQAKETQAALKGITFRITGERIRGAKGYVAYKYLRGAKVLANVKADLYLKVNGKWLDEVDKVTSC
ncbi:MAG: hypothetical protein ABR521_03645 [Gaiellaceae bacterium]